MKAKREAYRIAAALLDRFLSGGFVAYGEVRHPGGAPILDRASTPPEVVAELEKMRGALQAASVIPAEPTPVPSEEKPAP